jgi:hypothetical protein
MIDEKRLPPADHEIRVAMRPIGIRKERVEPYDLCRKLGRYEIRSGVCIEVESPVEITRAKIDSVTRAKQILDLGVWLRSAERIEYPDQCDLGRRQSCLMRQQSDDHLSYERFDALPRAAKLRDEHPAFMRIDDGR